MESFFNFLHRLRPTWINSLVVVKVILGDNSSQRLTLQNGLPRTADELVSELQRHCGPKCNLRLQLLDKLFGNEFMNLTSVDEIHNRGIIRVIYVTEPANNLSTSLVQGQFDQVSSVFLSFAMIQSWNLSRAMQPTENMVTLLSQDPKLKSNILEELVQAIVR